VVVETETGVVGHGLLTRDAAGGIDIPGQQRPPGTEMPDAVETTTAPGARLLLGLGGGAGRLTTMTVDAEVGLDRRTIAMVVSGMLAVKSMTTCPCRGELRGMSQMFKS
jgi:hypothetical protein